MRPHIIFRYNGIVLLFNAFFLLISALVSAVYTGSGFYPLLYSFIVVALFGVFPLIFVPPTSEISNKEGFFIVICSWLLSCLVGTLPYILYGGEFTLTNAWFESVSGYTTTGSTILTNIESLPQGLLFWRSSTHWMGGIGIIIFVLSVLPSMGKIGMFLYRTEISSLAAENFHYRTKKTLLILLYVYLGLTLAETVCLLFCGMSLFDAITHSFGTIATGGFSPKNLSVAYFQSFAVEMVIIIFMILSGIHFGLLFSAFTGKSKDLWRSSSVRYYILTLLAGVVFIAVYLYSTRYESLLTAFRHSAFQVVSVGTSTGFATTDTSIWPPFTKLLLIFFTLQCACAGSTSGGIKTDRMVILWTSFIERFKKLQHPSGVFVAKIDGSKIDSDTLEANILYVCVYLGVVFVSTLLLTVFGLDILSAFSGSAAAMGNVGPGFGIVGSMGNYSLIPTAGKWVLSATMLLGRLEIFGLILFFMVRWWK